MKYLTHANLVRKAVSLAQSFGGCHHSAASEGGLMAGASLEGNITSQFRKQGDRGRPGLLLL
jgi:hypothetical protein